MTQTKNTFFAIGTLLLTTHFYSNAMLITKKPLLLHPFQQKALRYCSQLSKSHTINIENIANYNHERDEKIVSAIALKHLPQLLSDVTPRNSHKMLENVMSTLNDNTTTSKIYLLDNKPAGFINYYIKQPWKVSPTLALGPNAHINFLAIDDEQHNKGIGSALLNYAIKDCDEHSVHTITLSTTDWNLEKYYTKFGFEAERSSKYTGCTKLKKQLRPHQIFSLWSAIRKWLYEFKQ